MHKNSLHIIETSSENRSSVKLSRKEEAEAKFDRLWMQDPEQFNPLKNCKERERLQRTLELINEFITLKDKKIADLGCGSGVLTRRLRDNGAVVDAVDVSSNALKALKEKNFHNIRTVQAYVPQTDLEDLAYDLVLSTELIGYLHKTQHRLFFSELSRLVKTNGYVVCSSALDVYSVDALERFTQLAETEFKIEKAILGYHSYWIRMKNFFKIPSTYAEGWKNKQIRKKGIQDRSSFRKIWFQINTSLLIGWIWVLMSWLVYPILHFIQQNRPFLLSLEKLCKFISDLNGVSEIIFIGKKRPLIEETPPEEMPVPRPQKKEIWE